MLCTTHDITEPSTERYTKTPTSEENR